jgi:hypothetical protein
VQSLGAVLVKLFFYLVQWLLIRQYRKASSHCVEVSDQLQAVAVLPWENTVWHAWDIGWFSCRGWLMPALR